MAERSHYPYRWAEGDDAPGKREGVESKQPATMSVEEQDKEPLVIYDAKGRRWTRPRLKMGFRGEDA